MAHKPDCPKSKDVNAACTLKCEETPAPETQICGDCGQEVGVNEKICPKCKADLEAAKEEDSLVERSLKRMKTKKEAAKKKTSPAPPEVAPAASRYKSPGLAKLFNRKTKE